VPTKASRFTSSAQMAEPPGADEPSLRPHLTKCHILNTHSGATSSRAASGTLRPPTVNVNGLHVCGCGVAGHAPVEVSRCTAVDGTAGWVLFGQRCGVVGSVSPVPPDGAQEATGNDRDRGRDDAEQVASGEG
jgi:hypothetical protein